MNQGRVPEGWEEKELASIADINMGQSPDSKNYNNRGEGVYLIQGNADCQNRKTHPRTWTTQITKMCDVDDIIMTVRAPVGMVSKSLHKACIGRGVCSIRFRYKNQYLYYYMINLEKSWSKLSQGTTFDAITSDDVKKLVINIPTNIKEQQKIAQILSTLDKNIEKTTETIEKYKKIKKGLMNDLLTGKIRIKDGKWVEETEFKYVEGVGDIPKEWEVCSIEGYKIRIIDGDRGSNYPSGNDLSKKGFCIFLNNKNIYNGKILYKDCDYISFKKDQQLRKGKLTKGDIVITTRGTVGNIGIYEELYKYPNVRINSGMVILREYNENFKKKFLIDYWIYIYQKVEVKIGSGSAQPQLPIKEMKNIKLVRPDLEEQQEISNILSKQDQLIEKEEQYLQKLQKLKNGLMNDLLTGKKRVKMGD